MNKEKLTQIIKYLIDKGVTASDFHDVYLNTTTPSEPKKEATLKKMGRPKKAKSQATDKSAVPLYTAGDVCSKLNVKPTELKQMIAEGDFPAPDNKGKWSKSTLSQFF